MALRATIKKESKPVVRGKPWRVDLYTETDELVDRFNYNTKEDAMYHLNRCGIKAETIRKNFRR